MSKSQPGDSFKSGDVLNNTYRIESLLGRGGLSEVYLARSEISGRRVAVKVLKSQYAANADYLVLMTREEDVREIRHDAVVRYFDNQRTPDGQVYLVMDFIDGPGLNEKLEEGGMSAEDLLILAKRISEGLAAAHEHNIIHRDLSPDNIILRNGDPAEAVIIDFGIAKDTKPGAETIVGNEFAGKYAFAAPEQLAGNTDARSDIYALGAVLLAAFRGKTPNIGTNPVEVVRVKSEPVDTTGVPDPLKSLIDKMTAPNPDARLASAKAVLAEISGGGAPPAEPAPIAPPLDDPGDKTVIAPPPVAAKAPRPEPKPAPAKPAKPPKKSGRVLTPVIALLLLVAVAGGAYVSGALDRFIDAGYPVADPFTLLIEKDAVAPPTATGNMPSEEAQAALVRLIENEGGTLDVSLARGDIIESWGNDVVSLAEKVTLLDEYRLFISGNTVTLTGLTNDSLVRKVLLDSLNGDGMPAGLTASVAIEQGPRLLPLQTVREILDTHQDCGPLAMRDPPAIGYAPGTAIVIDGKLGAPTTRVALFEALLAAAGDRSINIEAEILNASLCTLETAMPPAPAGGFEVVFGFGDRPDPNPSGRYFVGENPVIDIIIPAEVQDGFLRVSVFDVSGKVFHLLPNIGRPENDIAALRNGAEGPVAVRVAYPLGDAEGNGRLAFQVDDTGLGKSQVIVLRSAVPLFEEFRPTTESAAGYAQALEDLASGGGPRISSLDSAILVTARP